FHYFDICFAHRFCSCIHRKNFFHVIVGKNVFHWRGFRCYGRVVAWWEKGSVPAMPAVAWVRREGTPSSTLQSPLMESHSPLLAREGGRPSNPGDAAVCWVAGLRHVLGRAMTHES